MGFLSQGSAFLRLSELPVSNSPSAMRQRKIWSLGVTDARTRVKELQGGSSHFWGPHLFHWTAIGEKMGWYMRGITIKAVILSPWLRRTQPWLKSFKFAETEMGLRAHSLHLQNVSTSLDLPPTSQGGFGIAEGWVLFLSLGRTQPLQDSFYPWHWMSPWLLIATPELFIYDTKSLPST